MSAINYAESYQSALSQSFPYTLNFGALYHSDQNGKYRWQGAKTIEIPSITTNGRVDSNRDTIALAQRNFDNAWESKTLSNQRKWSTLLHEADIDQTNQVLTIANITKVYNEEQKFPEMDAYCVSKIYADWTAQGKNAKTDALTAENVLSVFDTLMLEMDNKRVPPNGRILYVTPAVHQLINQASRVVRVEGISGSSLNQALHSVDEVAVVSVPPELMKTAYDFTMGWKPGAGAKQIQMFLVHPSAVITPVSYQFSQLDAPSAGSEGKWVYFEESFEDVFILNKKADAIQFVVSE